jgi:periplasmic protein TonB
MYEAMRQRAPHSSKLAGVSATAMCLGLATWALLSGFGEQIVKAIQERTTFVYVPPTLSDPPEPVDQIKLNTATELPFPDVPLPPLDDFLKSDEQPPITVTASDGTETGAAAAPAPAPVRKWPVMRTTDKPPYPVPDIRGGNEGITGLLVCVGVNGRVTAATLDYSSGFASLDQAALKWIRGVRFAPGAIDGAAQAMCGHRVSYEWTLEEARR